MCIDLADIGQSGLQSQCAWQENKLAVLWTIGVFALNFGPVLVGPVLDWLGPKLTAFLGVPIFPCPFCRAVGAIHVVWVGQKSLHMSSGDQHADKCSDLWMY
jgi:hypothetical protein